MFEGHGPPGPEDTRRTIQAANHRQRSPKAATCCASAPVRPRLGLVRTGGPPPPEVGAAMIGNLAVRSHHRVPHVRRTWATRPTSSGGGGRDDWEPSRPFASSCPPCPKDMGHPPLRYMKVRHHEQTTGTSTRRSSGRWRSPPGPRCCRCRGLRIRTRDRGRRR